MASIEPRKNKEGKIISYRIRVCVGRDKNGRQYFASTTIKRPEGMSQQRVDNAISRAAAEFERAERKRFVADQAEAERIRQAKKINAETPLDKFILEEWWPSCIDNGEHKAKTIAFYNDTIKHIVPHFAGNPIGKVTPSMITSFLTHLRKDNGLAPRTVHNHYRTLKMIFAHAVRQDIIIVSPVDKVPPPRLERSKVEALPQDDIKAFFAALDACPQDFRLMMLLFVTTGLRRGEIAGLQWGDIDVDRCCLTVERNVVYTTATGIQVNSTKTANSDRTVPVMAAVMTEMLAYRDQYCDTYHVKVEATTRLYIFPGATPDVPRDPSAITRRVKRFMQRKGLPDLSPHDLRHSCATFFVQSGADIKSVQSILGHADASTTLNYYVRADFGQMQAATDALAQTLGIATDHNDDDVNTGTAD